MKSIKNTTFLLLTAITAATHALSSSSTSTSSTCTSPQISQADIQKISSGGVAIIPNWLPPHLVTSMHDDAQALFSSGQFRPDGLTNTAIQDQGFTAKADRQTFRGGAGWDSDDIGDISTRREFALRMKELRHQLARELNRPTLAIEGERRHEMTYNWYEPGAKLGRHLDEHHEETKGPKGWVMPTRRSVTWLVYLNEGWTEEEGGSLRCMPRSSVAMERNNGVQVGCHEGNLQVGWVNDGVEPVFLDVFRESGGAALYRVNKVDKDGKAVEERHILSVRDFEVPRQPIDFSIFLKEDMRESFEQISTSRLDPRFASAAANNNNNNVVENRAISKHDFDCSDEPTIVDVTPVAGTLVLFDSVSLPHLVREVTGKRQRIAATGWFHEDSQFSIEQV